MAINDGGPAFPVLEEYQQFNDDLGRYEDHYAPKGGMSLRDYFAAKLLAAMVPSMAFLKVEKAEVDAKFATRAYEMADAMLKAREAK